MINIERDIEVKLINLSFEIGKESPHLHEENQLLFFLSGKGFEYIEGEKYKILPGTFILVPEKKIHFFKSYSNKPSEILSIIFKLSSQLEETLNVTKFLKKPYMYIVEKYYMEEIKKIISTMINGNSDLKLFFEVLNIFFKSVDEKSLYYKSRYIREIDNYIYKNIGGKIEISELGRYLKFSTSYIRKIVKKIHGVSFTKYVHIKKIEYAEKLLLETKIPISKIAGICGFYDYNYFSRIFKKIKGVSPTEFRTKRV